MLFRSKEELKTKDIQMYILEYERVNEQLEEIKKKEEVALKDLENAAQQYSKSRKFLDDLEQTLNNNNEDIEKKKAQVNTNNIKAEQLEGNVKVYEQQISSAKENEEQFVLRVKQLDIQLDNEQSEYQLLLQQKEENTIKIEDCVAKQKEAENNINEIFACIKQQEQEIDHINQKTIHAMNESSDIKSEQKKYETMLEQLSIKKAEMNQSLFRLKTDVEKAKEASINLEGSILDKTTRIKDMNAKLQTKKYDLNEVERKKKSLLIKQQDIQKNFHSTNSHITTLKNLAERYEEIGRAHV